MSHFFPPLVPPPPAAADCERDVNEPCSQLSRALCSRPFPFPCHLSLCPAGREAMPICSSHPRTTFCSDQPGARIPTACLSLGSAGASERQESQPTCPARSGAHEFECRRAVPVLVTQAPTQARPLLAEHRPPCFVATVSQVPFCTRFALTTLLKPHPCRT